MRVMVDGYFDPLHVGHLKYFQAAHDLAGTGGDVLCRVAPDGDIHEKRPCFQPAADRLALVSQLRTVTDAEISSSLSHSLVGWLPNVLLKGKDWEGRLPDYIMKTCERIGCEVRYSDSMVRSSSDIVSRGNAIALDRMEYLWKNQPTPQPWEPVTDYSYEARRTAEGNHPELIAEHLFEYGDQVLDYGCGASFHLVKMLHTRGILAKGYDPRLPGSDTHIRQDHNYGLVICREVLEHVPVYDYLETVNEICRLSKRLVYITTRFAAHPTSIFRIDDRDDLDPTHICMPTKDFLRSLLVLNGFKCRPDLEEKMDHQQKGRCLVYERQ
jgi:cytidyltransferase-like protein